MDYIDYEMTDSFRLEAKQKVVINNFRMQSNNEAIDYLSQQQGQSYLMNGANFILLSNDNIVQELKDDNEKCKEQNFDFKQKLGM
ncbi:hypothetical protein SS50377_26581 [Spironucleus salmonicida]|uniref:Uncharacterized protein n=1 Tax=Spironucleus salmonicida TaxID=348837 RepID=V6LL81_9EUKA|nr:hypothetical protein SS50377_26581 [Spironucleus salmonicida]|eukprot:EST41434.1 Hypothetical protein SS50377_19151 [Spironucleus salmonicida]